MANRTVRVQTPIPGWTLGQIVIIDDTVPLYAALLASGRVTDYVPPAPGTVPVDHNAVVRLGDLEDPASLAGAALAEDFVTTQALVLAPSAPTTPTPGTVWINNGH